MKDQQIFGGPGDTFETAISIKGMYNNATGIKVEYFVLEKMFGRAGYDWSLQQQQIHERGDLSYDLMHLRLQDGHEVVAHFEITDFFMLIDNAIQEVMSECTNEDVEQGPKKGPEGSPAR